MTPATRQSLALLRIATSRAEVAKLLGVAPSILTYWLYKAADSDRYKLHRIPKKNGGVRLIMEPQGSSKQIQQRLAKLLSSIYKEAEEERATKRRREFGPENCVLAHGFKQGFGIITNANVHCGKQFVFNTDLKEFFPSISFGRVRGFFIADNTFRLHPQVATVLAQIACHNNQLPQGSPCSPVISNLIAHILDLNLARLAAQGGCSYTRYADDLTFSTNEKQFPISIARPVMGTVDRFKAGEALLAKVYRSGFSLNHDKTRMQLHHSRQEATGLTVNRSVNVDARYYKAVRAMCDHLFRNGYAFDFIGGKRAEVSDSHLQGQLDFIYAVRSRRRQDDINRFPRDQQQKAFRQREQEFERRQRTFTGLYRDFLNYRSFHGIDRPVIVGEGITDALYLNAAIRSLGALYPQLYDKADEKLLVDFYKHSDKRKYYQIGEGAGGIKIFVEDYIKKTERFKQPTFYPVILIVDNDKAGLDVLKACGKHGVKNLNSATAWSHVVSNLYIMPTPRQGGKDTVMEDLFHQEVLDEKIDGRVFTRDDKFDRSTHYGKVELAGKIVRPKRGSINWDRFDPILIRLVEILDDYQKRLAGTP